MAGKISEMTGVTPELTDEVELSRPNGGSPLTRKATLGDVLGLDGGGGGGGSAHPGFRAASWYPASTAFESNSSAASSGLAYFSPFVAPADTTITDLAARIVTASASGNFQLGVWAADDATKRPTGLPLGYTAATLSTGAGNTTVSGALNAGVPLTAGELYFFGIALDNTTATYQALGNISLEVPYLVGAANLSDYVGTSALCMALTYSHTFANNLNSLNITAGSVGSATGAPRAPLIHFKITP